MNKTYHFLAGLPRSGNTLLSALFNQNPNIYSSPISPLPSLMWNFANTCNNIEQINRNTENQIKAKMFLSSFINNYYKEIEKPVVIDREKVWGTPANLDIIKQYITPTPKIIFTVRDILEIIASFVKIDADYLKNGAYNSGYYIANYRSEKDLVAEYLMESNGDIGKGLLSLASAFYPENKGMFYIVEYNNLVFSPEETSGLYSSMNNNEDFKKLYEKYENSRNVKMKKKINARKLAEIFTKERLETGRIYVMNIDNANEHGSWLKPVYMSNLCQEIIPCIYDFLDMPYHEHNFNLIQKLETDNDEPLGFPKNLHDIRKSLSKSSTSTDILSDYIKHKYSNMEFWRDGSTMKIRGRDF